MRGRRDRISLVIEASVRGRDICMDGFRRSLGSHTAYPTVNGCEKTGFFLHAIRGPCATAWEGGKAEVRSPSPWKGNPYQVAEETIVNALCFKINSMEEG